MSAAAIKPKKKCCGSDPRCKRCPKVLKRMRRAGYAERRGDGLYVIVKEPSKKKRRALRTR